MLSCWKERWPLEVIGGKVGGERRNRGDFGMQKNEEDVGELKKKCLCKAPPALLQHCSHSPCPLDLPVPSSPPWQPEPCVVISKVHIKNWTLFNMESKWNKKSYTVFQSILY
jgi:hypothetical protein